MPNGDTAERIINFLDRKDEKIPKSVSNSMLLIALRELRDDVIVSKKILRGEKADGSDGLVRRVEEIERFKRTIIWIASPIGLAFLAGVGAYLIGLFIH